MTTTPKPRRLPAAGPRDGLALVVRRQFSATPDRVFDAWTQADQLTQWWGPAGVTCPQAEVDLRVGGSYRIVNRLPDGGLIHIVGEFVRIERPTLLVYSWLVEPGNGEKSLVTVRFAAHGADTALTISHSRIGSTETRDDHARGWSGCLDGLARFLEA